MTARTKICLFSLWALLLLQVGQAGLAPQAEDSEHWVATWASAQLEPRARGGVQPPFAEGFQNQTVRMIVRSSIGGSAARVRFSNAFGREPLEIGAARIAIRHQDSTIVPGSDRMLLFGGEPSVTIPPGAPIVSDPVRLNVSALSDLAISVYITDESGQPTTHSVGLQTTYVSSEGDYTAAAEIPDAATTQSWYWLSGVEVRAPRDAATVVTFGDSITDGTGSTPNENRDWPSLLANRLAGDPATSSIGVVNLGIAGNRILSDAAGVSALARFDRDVISQAGVSWLMLLEGINDIGGIARGTNPSPVSAETLITGMQQIVERAHTHGIKVIGCTVTPFEGAGYFSETGETVRQAVNDFIRTSGAFDAVVDFDAALRDPANPRQIRSDFHVGDYLHPNDLGYEAMADAVDLSIFNQGSN
jgi:lysophospholipase L1-like esterase